MPINFFKKIIRQEEQEEGFWEKRSPSKQCAGCIKGFYLFSGFNSQKEHLIFNDGLPTIVFFPKKEDMVRINADGRKTIIQSAWVDAGVMKNVYASYPDDVDELFVIRFEPGFFYRLSQLKPDFFRYKSIVTLADINFPAHLSEQLFSTESFDEKVDLVESYVFENASYTNEVKGLLHSVIESIDQAKGQISVGDILIRTGVNHKWLQRHFRNHFGFTPKEYILLQRFISVYGCMSDNPSDLLDVAVSNGYYDYNHLLKEFKSFTGKTPTEYFASHY